MKKLRIGVDLDDVLNNLVEVWLKNLNKGEGTDYQYDDIKTWDFISHTQENAFDYLNDETVNSLEPQPYAVSSVLNLTKEEDIEVYIITATHPNNIKEKYEWLKEHFPFISREHIIFAKDKSVVDFDILIDDALHNLEESRAIGIAYEKPWNNSDYSKISYDDLIYREGDLVEAGIYDKIQEYTPQQAVFLAELSVNGHYMSDDWVDISRLIINNTDFFQKISREFKLHKEYKLS